MSGVYEIRNTKNGKVYVGSSKEVYDRMKAHKLLLDRGAHHALHLQRAYNLDGREVFKFNLVEETCKYKPILVEREQYWMDYHRSYDQRYGYNTLTKAHSSLGAIFTPEHRAKLSAARKGKKLSESDKAKKSEAAKKQWSDPEIRNKMLMNNGGKKISISAKERWTNPEFRNKMKNIMDSPEYRKKVSEGKTYANI
jgi:group I intron endonuclease